VKATIGGIDLSVIVPLEITGVPKIDCFPKRVIASGKCTATDVELIRKNKIIVKTIVTNA